MGRNPLTKSRARFGKPSCPVFPHSGLVRDSRSAGRNPKMGCYRKAALGYLSRAHEQDRLAHAYLISGSRGSGKQLLAAELASLVNGTKATDVFSSKAREIFVAQPQSKSRRIVIGQIRNIEHALQMRASHGRRKVAIISDADRLQPQAANAFLKTLEEPPRDTLLLLLSALPEALPDTLVSRWTDVLRSGNGVDCRELPNARKETGALAKRFPTTEILRKLQRLEELRDQLSRNIQEALAIEVAFLGIFAG